MTPEEIKTLIESANWYHTYDLCGVMTPGRLVANLNVLDMIGVPKSLEGLRVLEIGSWDGPYTWELERRNPAVLHALDIQDPIHTGFYVAKQILGSKVEYHHLSVYDMPFKDQFDLVVFMGVYYHLRHPLLAFQRIYDALTANGTVHIEGAIMRETIDGQLMDVPSRCHFGQVGPDKSMWFTPNIACLKEWLACTGFEVLEAKVASRAFVSARKKIDFVDFEHEVV